MASNSDLKLVVLIVSLPIVFAWFVYAREIRKKETEPISMPLTALFLLGGVWLIADFVMTVDGFWRIFPMVWNLLIGAYFLAALLTVAAFFLFLVARKTLEETPEHVWARQVRKYAAPTLVVCAVYLFILPIATWIL